MKLIGISGTDGSGKDSVAKVLVEHGWLFISVSDLLREELAKRGVPLGRQNLRKLSAQWRREHGLGVLIDKAVEKFKTNGGDAKYKGLAVASLRNPGEADRVHELGGKVVWTDAKPHIRYRRLVSRMRGNEDSVTFEEFMAEEQVQMRHSGDRATLSLSGVKDLADISIENSGHDIEAFKIEAEKALAKFL